MEHNLGPMRLLRGSDSTIFIGDQTQVLQTMVLEVLLVVICHLMLMEGM